MDSLDQANRPLLEAMSFAARAHDGQIRKDGKTPYVSHAFRVCLIVRHVFGIDDSAMLTAAVLHDTIEDTTTDFDDLETRFGAEVAQWVACLSKDKRLQDDEREAQYRAGLATAVWQVKACKLADIFDNLLDCRHLSADHRRRTVKRCRLYLDAIDQPDLPPSVQNARQLVLRLLAEVQSGLG
jgi:guanosine-3',5'-bis(diphosphate) 3'-pyrophosphohydrolase